LARSSQITVPTPIFGDGLIFVPIGYRPIQPIYALWPGATGDITTKDREETSGAIAWSKIRGGPYMPTPIHYQGHLYCCSNAGIVTCHEARTGKGVYRKRLGGSNGYTASPVAADGRLYFTGEDGKVYVVQAGPAYKLLAISDLGETCLATPPWRARGSQTQVSLNRLTRRQTGELMLLKSGLPAIPPRVLEQVADRTDGVPLFVEEVTAMMLDAGTLCVVNGVVELADIADAQAIPATLQDLLMARLDRMASNLDVVQLAAAIGREFSYELLSAAASCGEDALQQELAKLVDAELLFQYGRPPGALPVQARSGPRRRLSVAAEDKAPAVPPAHCRGDRAALCRNRQRPVGTARSSFH
jgi:hypothetical protein